MVIVVYGIGRAHAALLQDEVENKVRANGRKLFKSHDTRITESDLDNILRELQKEERISDQEQGEFILRFILHVHTA